MNPISFQHGNDSFQSIKNQTFSPVFTQLDATGHTLRIQKLDLPSIQIPAEVNKYFIKFKIEPSSCFESYSIK